MSIPSVDQAVLFIVGAVAIGVLLVAAVVGFCLWSIWK
jgi:hypothetical protein